jgi:hypothetical protein
MRLIRNLVRARRSLILSPKKKKKKIQADGNFDTVEQEIIQAMPQAALDAIEAKVGSSATLRTLRAE